ncbi:MAG: hypothetical protein CL910_19350 [Deltaproteobacteria bacterium]|jgi:DNA-binding transcriptional regulator GbsR (MarR family)|nr:hypothetical protein [Deltaproteobacteria bacterium]
MDDVVASFVDGMGAAAASSGILSQQQGRIFALLYLAEGPLSLDEIADQLEQSKSNISVNIRTLVEWHLVKRRPIRGSRKDHYEAATDFFRAFQEIFERRFRWTVRQVIDVVKETSASAEGGRRGTPGAFRRERLQALGGFFGLLDAGIGAFVSGKPFPAQKLAQVVPLPGRAGPRAR